MIRLIFFIGIFILAATGPVIIFVVAAGIYAIRYAAYELIIIGAMIDSLYGTAGVFSVYYTVGAILLVLSLEWIKPKLTLYT